jgi:PleD family two-component response regulator
VSQGWTVLNHKNFLAPDLLCTLHPERRSGIDHNGISQSITVSVGVGQWDGESSLTAFIDQVDAALYQAKQQGRNRIEVCA